LAHALKGRISQIISLWHALFAAMPRASYEGMESIFDDREKDEALMLIASLFKLDSRYNESVANPVIWVKYAPQELKHLVLAEIWLKPFSSDDPGYNLSVMLDTSGGEIERLGIEIILKSLALITQATNLPNPQLWRLERSPYEPQTEEDLLELALSHLLTLGSSFDSIKIWVLGQFSSLFEKYPNQKVNALQLFTTLNSNFARKMARAYLGIPQNPTEENEEGNEGELFVYKIPTPSAQNSYILLHSPDKYVRISLPNCLSDVEQREEPVVTRLGIIFSLISRITRGQDSFAHASPQSSNLKLLELTPSLIDQVKDLPQRIRFILKLLIYYPTGKQRNDLVQKAISSLNKMKNQIEAGHLLKEIRHWTVEDEGLREMWQQSNQQLENPLGQSIIQGRLYPSLKKVVSGNTENITFQATGLLAMLYDLQQFYALPEDVEDLWEIIHSSNAITTEKAIQKIYEKGIRNRIELTLRGAIAISYLLATGQERLVIKLMPCLSSPDPEAVSIVHSWLSYKQNSHVPAFAALLLLEVKIINTTTFGILEKVLFDESFLLQDQIRNRINLALNRNYFYSSQIGIDCLLMIEKSLNKHYDSKPYLSRGLAWFHEYLVFDSPDTLEELISLAKRKGRKSKLALRMLRKIHYLSYRSQIRFLQALREETGEIKLGLFRSCLYLVHIGKHYMNDGNLLDMIHKELLHALQAEGQEIRYFALEALSRFSTLSELDQDLLKGLAINEDLQTALLAMEALARLAFDENQSFLVANAQSDSPTTRKAALVAITKKLVLQHKASKKVFDILEADYGQTKQDILDLLIHAAGERWYNTFSKNSTKLFGIFFAENPEVYAEFAAQAAHFLPLPHTESPNTGFSYAKDISWNERASKISALAAGAEKLPMTFLGKARNIYKMETYLTDLVQKEGIFTSRMSALSCLSFLRNMTRSCANAFSKALKDISDVQHRVVDVMFRFGEIDPIFIQEIAQKMDHESYSARYGMVNMLGAIGTYARTNADLRAKILDVLLEKRNDPNYQVPIFLLKKKITISIDKEGNRNESEEGNHIQYMGRLDLIIYSKILEVAGVKQAASPKNLSLT